VASIIAAFAVKDYDTWRSNFDGEGDQRREYGIKGGRVYQDAANPNLVTVVVEGELFDLHAYAGSQDLKDAMAKGGVVGPPQMSFVNEVT